ncbi:MAG: PilZ domain-containing protein [Nitrospira sp.]|nr:PilZ domain-containing protein [bacterium]MBL7050042.1 PilZ domain-containing protein [Nitrospira sp.]
MERQDAKRNDVEIEVLIISDRDTCPGIIRNLSAQGLFVETEAMNILSADTRLAKGSICELKFNLNNEALVLRCEVKWSFKAEPDGLVKKIGMKILFPPAGYTRYFRQFDITD